MSVRRIDVRERVMAKNDEIAAVVRRRLRAARVPTFNLVSSPGAGKTALLERTLQDLGGDITMAVVTGDVQTQNEADRLARHTDRLVQAVVPNGACHLDARQIATALDEIGTQTKPGEEATASVLLLSDGQWNRGRDYYAEGMGPNLGYKLRHKEGYFPVPPADALMDIRNEMMLTMIECGLDVEAQHHEADFLFDVHHAQVRHHLEFLAHPVDDRLLDQLRRKEQPDTAFAHRAPPALRADRLAAHARHVQRHAPALGKLVGVVQ